MHPYSDPAMSRRSLLVRAGTMAAGVGCGLLLAACGQAATITTQTSASAPAATAASSGTATSAATASPSTVASAASTATAAPATASSTAAASVTAAPAAVGVGNKAAVALQYYTSLNQRQQKLFDPMVVQPFTQAHPSIAIEVVESQGSFYAKLTTMVAAGTPPDVVWEAYPEAYLGKLITDLTSYVNRDKLDISVYPQYAMDYDGLWQGKVLGLPNQTGGNWPVMPFNHDLFAGVGLPDPPDHWEEASWSYSAFVDACQKLTKTGSDGTPQSFAINDFGLGTVMLWWGLRYGGQWLSDDFTTVTCDSPQMIQGLQQLFDLPLKYKVMPKPGQLKTVFGDSNAMNLLKAGKLAMVIDSGGDMYNVATNDQAGADLMFGAQPTFPASTGDDQDVDPNGLAVGTKHPEEGWTFIRYQAETPGWAISRGNLPARKDLMPAWEQALWGGGIGTKARVAVYEDSINHTAKKDPIGHLSNWRDLYTNLIAPEFNKVWAGQAAVSDVLHALRPQLQSQVAKGMPA
jgi:hypothetical protein